MSQKKLGPLQRRSALIHAHNKILDERLYQLFAEIERIQDMKIKADRLIYEAPEISVTDELISDARSVFSNKLEPIPDQELLQNFRRHMKAGE